MSKKSVLVAVTATLALGGLAACGDDEESEASSSALTDTELASEAEAICKEHNDAIQAGFEEEGLKADPDPVQVRTVVKDYVLPHYTAWIGQQERRLNHCARNRLDLLEAKISALANSSALREPARRILEYRQTLDRRSDALARASQQAVDRAQNTLRHLSLKMERMAPEAAVDQARLKIRLWGQKLSEGVDRGLARQKARLERAAGVLTALSPEGTLSRGYTITLDAQGRALTRAAEVEPGSKLRTRFADGEVESISAQR